MFNPFSSSTPKNALESEPILLNAESLVDENYDILNQTDFNQNNYNYQNYDIPNLSLSNIENNNDGYGIFSQPITNTATNFLPNLQSPDNFEQIFNNQSGSPSDIIENILGQGSLSNLQRNALNSGDSNILNSLSGYLNEINGLNLNINDIAQRSALQQAQGAYIDALLEAQATQKILQMNNQSTQSNAILDQQMLALRSNYNILSKQTEQYVLDAQLRELLTNLFFNLEKTMMDNTFQRAKSVVGSAKY